MRAQDDLRKDLMTKAADDERFRELLLKDPKSAVKDVIGIEVPDNINLHVHEESRSDIHLLVPSADQLSDEELESMKGDGVASPLSTMMASKVTHLYDMMDSAYGAKAIHEHVRASGRIPIIDIDPRRNATLKQSTKDEASARRAAGLVLPKSRRHKERSAAECVKARLKDEFGARSIWVRGHAKVACHLVFRVLALTAGALMWLHL